MSTNTQIVKPSNMKFDNKIMVTISTALPCFVTLILNSFSTTLKQEI